MRKTIPPHRDAVTENLPSPGRITAKLPALTPCCFPFTSGMYHALYLSATIVAVCASLRLDDLRSAGGRCRAWRVTATAEPCPGTEDLRHWGTIESGPTEGLGRHQSRPWAPRILCVCGGKRPRSPLFRDGRALTPDHRANRSLTVRSSLEEPVLPQELPGDFFWGLAVHVHGRVQFPQSLAVQLLGDGGEDLRERGVLVHNLLADGE